MSTYVVVGGVAGGATAAARLRRKDEHAEIIVLERGEYVSFANCGLPYHIGGSIAERDSLLVSTPEKLEGEFGIDVRTRHELIAIDRDAQSLTVRDLRHGSAYELHYDKLVLSPGAKPFVPPIKGVDSYGVFSLRTIPDMDAIKGYIASAAVSQAVVVGGGFIGLEMAENLAHLGIQVTLVEMMDQVMTAIDFEMAAMIHRHLRDKGVRLGLGDGLSAIGEGSERTLSVELVSGRVIETDMVILALGVRPENALACDAGLEVGPRGHIVVNEAMQTSDANIYAVGDAIQVVNPITNSPTAIPLAGPANRQARIAADNITGAKATYQGTMGTSIVKVFDMTVACTGVNSVALDRANKEYLNSITHSFDHVSYYPGATPQAVKLIYEPQGRLLGAQVVGLNAVDRTINVLATAIKANMSVYDLEHLELAYAPPFGAAKDAVNIAGYVAANQLRGDTDLITWDKIKDLDPEQYGILDVRTDVEWLVGHIDGATHMLNEDLRSRLGELDRSKTWVLVCSVGRRAYVMERMLKQNGFRALNLSGGMATFVVATEEQSNLDTFEAETQRLEPVAVLAGSSADGGNGTNGGTYHIDATVNACGLQCPGPIMAVYKEMQKVPEGHRVEVVATDPGFGRDIKAWSERTGNPLLDLAHDNGTIRAVLEKGRGAAREHAQ